MLSCGCLVLVTWHDTGTCYFVVFLSLLVLVVCGFCLRCCLLCGILLILGVCCLFYSLFILGGFSGWFDFLLVLVFAPFCCFGFLVWFADFAERRAFTFCGWYNTGDCCFLVGFGFLGGFVGLMFSVL